MDGQLRRVQTCYSMIIVIMLYGFLSAAAVHSIILYRIVLLWDNRKIVSQALISGFFLCLGGTVVLSVFDRKALANSLQYLENPGVCAFGGKSLFTIAVWCPMVFYNLCVLLLLFVGILGNPRRQDSQIALLLYRDGFIMYLVFFAIRLARLIPSSFLDAGDFLKVLVITWAMEGVQSRQLLLRVKRSQSGGGDGNVNLWHSSQQEPSESTFAGTMRLTSTVQVWEEIEMRVI
ncbi:hypothetical protein DAEQUDRAFT_455142 [Daedalea quercina L-15889]|uniref:Glucose receptor Git3 N-terminal domain-containing protein n=1 Tax=Daedalea quercina L-15889 TaxID=1314783 RepID=A0A165N2Z5_9APHY|nr:hypothetical protein DAEQUDRAFT_455142 [Daedalea quercina L-15889]